MHRWLGLAALLASACTPPTITEDVAPRDATRDGPRGMCVNDRDCDDAIFCNGAERCMPGASGADMFGCLPPTSSMPCLASQMCSEATQRCRSDCARAPDADGDGHRAAECGGDDCDDSDANRFPGNPEVCDGAHDEDCVLTTVGTRDNDRDGANSSVCCNIVAGSAVSCGPDCDDARSDVGPASAEVCDAIDNNCNGIVDEGTPLQAFRPDCDGDGFGNASTTPVMSCTQPTTIPPCARAIPASTWSTRTGDCQDDDETIHVGVPELCDGVDNNCDGTVDENPAATSSCGTVPVGAPACAMGRCSVGCTSPAADCDGVFDNGCEIDLSTSNANCGGCGHRCGSGEQCVGSVCVQLLCPPGTHDCGGRCVSVNSIDSCGSRCSPCPQPPHSTASCEGTSFQACILSCADNYVEVHGECAPAARLRSPRHGAVIGTRRPTFQFDCVECSNATVQLSTNAAFTSPIEFTGFAPIITADRDVAAGNYFWRAQYPSAGSAPPSPVASLFVRDAPAGAMRAVVHVLYDYNGDARVDTAIGAPASSATGAGSVFVFDGTGAGLAGTPLEIVAPEGEASFGATVANAGDVNGDGRSDLIVGVPDHLGDVGRVYVFVSRSTTTGVGAPVVLEALEPMHHFGRVITGGDFDGDGFGDVAAAEGNAINVYYGRPSGIRTVPDQRFSLDTPTANGDAASISSGDVNGDGYDDMLIGADSPNTATNPSAVPSVVVYLGFDFSVTEGPPPQSYAVAGRVVGTHVAFAGDLDGNGYGDIVASSYAASESRAVLFLENGFGPPTVVEIGAPPFSTGFPDAVSWGGDIDGDGYDDVLFGVTSTASIAWLRGSPALGTNPFIGATATVGAPPDVGSGWSMLGVGDVDGDHFADVIVGVGGVGGGSARFFNGGMTGPIMSAMLTPARALPRFGTSIAWAVPRSVRMPVL